MRLRSRRSRRGAVLVEFAFVMTLLLFLLFGIVEVGLLMKNQTTLAQSAREAVRSAAVGSQTSVASSRARSTATGLTLTSPDVVLEKSADNGVTWAVLCDSKGRF